MADISFTQTFHHTDWVDDIDRVRAAEPNGFNARFAAIETDLAQLSAVVAEVDDVLSHAGSRQRLTLPPTLVPTEGATPWLLGSDGSASVVPGSSASGLLNVVLPNGATLLSFRAFGLARGASVSISLSRVQIGSSTPQVLATVTGNAIPYNRVALIDPSVPKTSATTSRFLIQATVPVTPADAFVSVGAFQITYSLD